MINKVIKAIGMAMGVAALVLSIIKQAPADALITMLAVGVTCLGISSFSKEDNNENRN